MITARQAAESVCVGSASHGKRFPAPRRRLPTRAMRSGAEASGNQAALGLDRFAR